MTINTMADKEMDYPTEDLPDEVIEYQRSVEAEIAKEFCSEDPVMREVTLSTFVSRSKGIRNGKRRIRKHLKEVTLIKYGYHFRQPHNFNWDVASSELLGDDIEDREAKLQEIILGNQARNMNTLKNKQRRL